MQALLVVLAIIGAALVGGALAIVRVDHMHLNNRLDNLELRMERLERSRAVAQSRNSASAQLRRTADQEDSR